LTNAFAVARPIPLVPPVMSAVFPSSLFIYFPPLFIKLSDCEDDPTVGAILNQASFVAVYGYFEIIATSFPPNGRIFAWLRRSSEDSTQPRMPPVLSEVLRNLNDDSYRHLFRLVHVRCILRPLGLIYIAPRGRQRKKLRSPS